MKQETRCILAPCIGAIGAITAPAIHRDRRNVRDSPCASRERSDSRRYGISRARVRQFFPSSLSLFFFVFPACCLAADSFRACPRSLSAGLIELFNTESARKDRSTDRRTDVRHNARIAIRRSHRLADRRTFVPVSFSTADFAIRGTRSVGNNRTFRAWKFRLLSAASARAGKEEELLPTERERAIFVICAYLRDGDRDVIRHRPAVTSRFTSNDLLMHLCLLLLL